MDQISAVFQNTLCPTQSVRVQAEQTLAGIIFNNETLSLFFNYIANKAIALNLRTSALIFLKQYVKDYWFNDTVMAMSNQQKIMPEDAKNFFKENVVALLLQVEPGLCAQIKEMISSVVEHAKGYYIIWPELMTKLAEILKQKNYPASTEVYDLIRKVIRRYHIDQKSKSLFEEIINTMDKICPILTEDGLYFSKFLVSNPVTKNELPCMIILKRIIQIFYSLNFQDFPEFFEDHLKEWIEILCNCVKFKCDVEGIYDEFLSLKTKTLKSVNLYFSNYFDDIENYYTVFYSPIWELNFLVKKSNSYSRFTKELLQFYANNIQYQRLKNLKQEDVNTMISNLVLPNLQMSDNEKEEFEDNPVNYLKSELQEADLDSNRFFAINLLKYLIDLYPNLITSFINPTIQTMLNNYYADRNKYWNEKVTAINLIFATYIKTFAARLGATELSPKVNSDLSSLIVEVFTKEFQNYSSPIITQVYSLKFLINFRLQIPVQFLSSVFEMLINILNGSGKVCQNACLITLEKILLMKDLNTSKFLAKDALSDQTTFNNLTSSLLKLISSDMNIFAMRCFYRSLILTNQEFFKGIMVTLTPTIQSILKNIMANSQQDEFNYFFFEIISLFMKKIAELDVKLVSQFEESVRNDLTTILTNSITDLMGYTFQFFSLYLSLSNDNSEHYNKLLQSVLFDLNSWNINMIYMFNPFIAFLKVNLMKNPSFFNNQSIIDQIFKICQQLHNLKCFKQIFEILDYLINFLNPLQFANSITSFLTIVVKTLTENKKSNPKVYHELGAELLLFISKMIIKLKCESTLQILSSIGGMNLLAELIDLILVIQGFNNKKLVYYSYCFFITSCNNIPLPLLNTIAKWLIMELPCSFKMTASLFRSKDNEDISYAARNYNKVINADVKVQIPDYVNIEKNEELQMFFNAASVLLNNLKINLVNNVKSELSNKDFLYIQSQAKKFNFPVAA